jgi:cytochrome c biogenesis protein CcmG, thiol:disulfide interchange protein DsbE
VTRGFVAAALLALLIACGGGSDPDGSAPAADDAATQALAEAAGAASAALDDPPPVADALAVPPAPTAGPTPTEPDREELEAEPSIPLIARLPDPSGYPDTAKGLPNGEFAPDLVHLDMRSGEEFRLSRWTGPTASEPSKVVVVGFTASWCGPCRQSYPFLQQMQQEHGADLKVVLLTTDATVEDKAKHVARVDDSGLDAPLLDPSPDTLRAWLGQRRNVPHFFVINRAGEILVQDRGFGQKVKRMLPGQLRYALNHPEYVVRR